MSFFNDDEEKFEENQETERAFRVGETYYSSIQDLTKNGSDEDILSVFNYMDNEILKTEEALRLAENSKNISNILTFVGVAFLCVASCLTGTFKKVLTFTGPVIGLGGLIAKTLNDKNQNELNDQLDELYATTAIIEDEIFKRIQNENHKENFKEIFAEV